MKADNKTKTLKTDSNADLIFKKGDYVHTYIVIDTSGLPTGATLNLLDENLNQLYSPYDVNANQVKTPCTIIVGEIDAVQLPANYIDNEYTDFDAGTYNWKLKYHDKTGKTFEDKIIPITIQIIDFDLETNLTPKIYPNENIQIQLKTWVNTNPQTNDVDIDRLTTNAVYDNTTGIITYPNIDINDLTIGQHIETINQYELNYTVKNPIEIGLVPQKNAFYHNEITTSSNNHSLRSIGVRVAEYDSITDYYPVGGVKDFTKVYINGIQKSTSGYNTLIYDNNVVTKRIYIYDLPPGTYSCTVEGNTTECDTTTYVASGTFEITTTNCEIILEQPFNNTGILKAKYTYNDSINIPNATLGLLDKTTSTLIETKITDSNGECQWEIDKKHCYQVVALDYDETYLLTSNIINVSEIWELIMSDSGMLNDEGYHPNNWWNYRNRINVSIDEYGTTLTGHNSEAGYYIIAPYGNISNNSNDYNYFDKWCIEFDVVSITTIQGKYIGLYRRDNIHSEQSIRFNTTMGMDNSFSGHVICKYDGTNFYYKVGDNEIQSQSLTLDIARLGFLTANTNDVNICFKNFKIYSEPKLILSVIDGEPVGTEYLINIQLIDTSTNGIAQKSIELYDDDILLTTLTTDNNGKCNYTLPGYYDNIILQAKYGNMESNIWNIIVEPL